MSTERPDSGGFADPVASLHIALDQIVRQRDDAREALKRLHDFYEEVKAQRDEYAATVERLRAAQQLPDVGPVNRGTDESYLRVDGYSFDGTQTAEHHRMRAAQSLAVAAYIESRDAEADSTSSDDGGCDQAEVDLLRFELGDHVDEADACRAIRALDAHRARGGQEAGQ